MMRGNVYLCMASFPSGLTCKKRMLDLKRVELFLKRNNYNIVDVPDQADFIIQMTCSYNDLAKEISLKRMEELRDFKGRKLILGCLGAIAPELLRSEFSYEIITTKELDTIGMHFEHEIPFKEIPEVNDISDIGEKSEYNVVTQAINSEDSKFHIVISRGCLGNCAYCGIKKAVGRLKSKPIDKCVEEFKSGLGKGYKRFRLLADDIGAYGLDQGKTFPQLLQKLISCDGDYVIERIHEVHPQWLIKYGAELVDLLKIGKISGINISLQSPSKRLLKLMQRPKFNMSKLIEILLEIRELDTISDLGIGFMVGLPTETEKEFQESIEFLKIIDANSGYYIMYTGLPDTKAFAMKGQIDDYAKRMRMKKVYHYLTESGYKVTVEGNHDVLIFGRDLPG